MMVWVGGGGRGVGFAGLKVRKEVFGIVVIVHSIDYLVAVTPRTVNRPQSNKLSLLGETLKTANKRSEFAT